MKKDKYLNMLRSHKYKFKYKQKISLCAIHLFENMAQHDPIKRYTIQ